MKLQQQISQQLKELNPIFLDVINESSGHGGYYEGKESHFKVVVVTELFEGLRQVQRHQKIYAQVNDLLVAGGGSIHALAIHAHTPNEWDGLVPTSPKCVHGVK